MESPTTTDIRLECHRRGFSVLPITGKRPPMDEWQKLSANSESIALWPKLYPFAGNTGVLTRSTPAIDIDIYNPDAAEALENLARARFEEHGHFAVRVGLWPKRAVLFRTDKPFRKLTLKLINPTGKGEKIEILGDGEQVVIHGIHPDTRKPYSWTGGAPWDAMRAEELPYLDEELAREFLRDAGELLCAEYGYQLKGKHEPKTNGADGEPQPASDWGKLLSDIYAGTDVHEATTRLAASFVGLGISGGAAVARLRSIVRGSPAWEENARWRDRYDDIPRLVRTAQEKYREQQEEEAGRAPTVGPTARWYGERDPLEGRSWLIEGLTPEVGSGLIAGQWGTYKTFLALELAHCVMTGRPFLGQDIARPGGVLFFALEGASELELRLKGALDHKGSKRLERTPFAWHEACPPLTHPKAADQLIKMAEPVAIRLREQFDLPLSLILVDTIIAGAGYRRDGQDNDAATTHAIMQTLARLARATGAFVLGLDHYGKDASVGTRGSSAKEGGADLILACLADKNEAGQVSNPRLVIRKRRSGPNGEEFPFQPRVVEVGTNKFGKPETTLVLDWGTSADQPARPTGGEDDWGKSKPVRHLRKVIMSLMVEHGTEIQPFRDGGPIQALKVELAEAEFLKSYPAARKSDNPKRDPKRSKERAFSRALEDAVDRNVVTTREMHGVEWIWLSRDPARNA
jgi:AAA domain/Bifunctional DNA primase/polymerase, N-terminal